MLEERPELGRARSRTLWLTRCASPGSDGSLAEFSRRARGRYPRHALMVACHARLVEVRPDTGPTGGAAVQLSAVEVRALWNILGLVAAGGSLTEKPEREMARRLQTALETALGD